MPPSSASSDLSSSLSVSESFSRDIPDHEREKLSNAYLGPSGLINQEILNFIDPTSIDTEDLLQTALRRQKRLCMFICSCSKLDNYDMYSNYAQAIQTQLDNNYDKAVGPSTSKMLLPPQTALKIGKKTLVLDMDETLIHSTFASVKGAEVIRLPLKPGAGDRGRREDYYGTNTRNALNNSPSGAEGGNNVGVGAKSEREAKDVLDGNSEGGNRGESNKIRQNNTNSVSVLFRPYVEDFLLALYPYYELVIFTASLPEYANKVLALLEERVLARAMEMKIGKTIHELFSAKLYRNSCVPFQRNYVKDMSLLGRDLKNVIILDNNPICFSFQPDNGILSNTWCGNKKDTQLKKLIPILIRLSSVDDVRTVIGTTEFQVSVPK